MSYSRNSSLDLRYNEYTSTYDAIDRLYSFTVNPTPSDATVTFTGGTQTGNTVQATYGTEITYVVSKDHYVSQSGTVYVYYDDSVNVTLPLQQHTFAINPVPADSLVILNATGYTQYGNSITVPYGTTVNYSVSHNNYFTETSSATVTGDSTLTVTLTFDSAYFAEHGITEDTDLGSLDPNVIAYLDLGNLNPTITAYNDLGADLYNILYTQYTAPLVNDLVFRNIGRIVSYVRTYNSSNQTMTMVDYPNMTLTRDSTEYLEWNAAEQRYIQPITITINATPNYATVEWNVDGTISYGTSITVNRGTSLTYTVSAVGYESTSQTIVANVNTTIPVVLDQQMLTFTINPTPNDANVTLTATGYTQVGNSITVPYGTTVYYTVAKAGLISQTGSRTITSTNTLPITLNGTLTILPDPSDATVVLTATGYTQSGNSITVPYGTTVNYTVSRSSFITQSSNITVYQTTTGSVTLNYAVGTVIFESSTPGTYQFYINGNRRNEYFITTWGGGADGFISSEYIVKAVNSGGTGAYVRLDIPNNTSSTSRNYSSGTWIFTVGSRTDGVVVGSGYTTVYDPSGTQVINAGPGHWENDMPVGGADNYNTREVYGVVSQPGYDGVIVTGTSAVVGTNYAPNTTSYGYGGGASYPDQVQYPGGNGYIRVEVVG